MTQPTSSTTTTTPATAPPAPTPPPIATLPPSTPPSPPPRDSSADDTPTNADLMEASSAIHEKVVKVFALANSNRQSIELLDFKLGGVEGRLGQLASSLEEIRRAHRDMIEQTALAVEAVGALGKKIDLLREAVEGLRSTVRDLEVAVRRIERNDLRQDDKLQEVHQGLWAVRARQVGWGVVGIVLYQIAQVIAARYGVTLPQLPTGGHHVP